MSGSIIVKLSVNLLELLDRRNYIKKLSEIKYSKM